VLLRESRAAPARTTTSATVTQSSFRVWTARELVGLVADQPPDFPPGTAWSYSNTGYVLLGLIVEAATGHTLGQELASRVFGPLGLHDSFLPVDSPGIPSPSSRGYSLPLGAEQGPLLDFTVYNPSPFWGAGNLISSLDDLTRFFRALLGGRLLPPGLLAEMTTPVPTGQPGVGYGLGLLVLDTPVGRLVGHDGGVPGSFNIVLSTQDGRRQLGVVRNEHLATPAVSQAFDQAVAEIVVGLLVGAPSGGASTGAALRAAVQARAPTPAARALEGVLARRAALAQP
jgi:D-alanyl-D-alanine carboxypeptidase